jgi:hypothetical protein
MSVRRYTKAEIAEWLLKDLIPQALLNFLLGCRTRQLFERNGLLTKAVSGHRCALYPTAQYLKVKQQLETGGIAFTIDKSVGEGACK